MSYTTYLKSDRLQTIRKQWMSRKVKDTKFIILANFRNLKKVDVTQCSTDEIGDFPMSHNVTKSATFYTDE